MAKDLDSSRRGDDFFSGPFFIVGMPRSGTKLLRDLMNEHPRIGITNIETHFLPHWIKHQDRLGDLSDPSVFSRFYRDSMKLPYFLYMAERAALIREEVWYGMCRSFTIAGVFEALIRHDAQAPYGSDRIWGDKTPAYISHLSLLKNIYPEARFIHIIRDVRDYCLSVHKAWGKNMVRAAQRWCDDIRHVRASAKNWAGAYLEVRYEDLLEDPAAAMQRICSFLSVEFDPRMVCLSKPAENLGDAKGWSSIKKDNARKYLRHMTPGLRKEIEALAGPLLEELGYPVDNNKTRDPAKISRMRMLLYKINDGFMILRYRIHERGWWQAMKWSISFHKVKD